MQRLARFLQNSIVEKLRLGLRLIWKPENGAARRSREGIQSMPLYTYHCKECDKDTELLVRFGETPACPLCGGQTLERLMSRPTAQGKSAGIMKAARSAAARAGHLSNFSRGERRS